MVCSETPNDRWCRDEPICDDEPKFSETSQSLWYEIFDIVKQNCTTDFEGSPNDDAMERLLRSRKEIKPMIEK